MFLIINADDLGANKEVNDAIYEMMSAKRVTSATLLANGPCIKEAVKEVSYFPECSFGVHLNVIKFQPLVSIDELRFLLDEDGCFNGIKKIKEIKITSSLSHAVYLEFCSQIEELISLGVKISHIDSHYHVHLLPKMFRILKCVQKKYGLQKVRISKNIYPYDQKISKKRLIRKQIYNFMIRHYYPTKTTSGFTNFLTLYENGKLNKLRHKTIEVNVHPGAPAYAKETALLRTSWQEQLPFRVNLINYYQL